jgi:hypothetical protein
MKKSNISIGKQKRKKKRALCVISLILKFARRRRNILAAYNKNVVMYVDKIYVRRNTVQ